MIERMRKLNLIALSYERDGLLDALERTNAVEVTLHAEEEGTEPLPMGGEELRARISALENSLSVLLERETEYRKEHKLPALMPPVVSAERFFAARDLGGEMDALSSAIDALAKERAENAAERARLGRELKEAGPYLSADPFDSYRDTAFTRTRLGILPASSREAAVAALQEIPLVDHSAVSGDESVLLALTAHRSVFEEALSLLEGFGFRACPYTGDRSGAQLIADLTSERNALEERSGGIEEEFHALAERTDDFKCYLDFLGFELEKAELSEKLRTTERTFLLEAFVPMSREEEVKAALDGAEAVWYAFSDPKEDEFVPTLMKNNKVVENFETITNMYSVPSARELDPNTVMAFFYSLFLGFIMADVGYGLMMLLGGGFLYYKNRAKKGGVKSLAGVFAIGGIFAIVWGFLFNSFLGLSLLPFTVMPDAQTKMWSLMGIEIPAILIISLLIGLVQIMAGYLCKAAQYWRKGQFFDGLFEGFVWALFSLGALIAVVGLLTIENDGGEVVFQAPILAEIGGIIAAACLVVAVLTAGRHEKFLGKLTKGFGSLYGLINYFTDVLSYIRLYGLMLTGAVIAQVISRYSVQFLTSGSFLIVLGVLLMVVGHVFNLAISLLGAYIHDARLQYVEFFGRFYTGEGRLFTPLGSDKKYISVVG